MEPEFWLAAWEEGRRGFHRDAPDGDLVKHAGVFPDGGRILVPLCGATHDLRWLADQGHAVVGVELSPLAASELAEREGLSEGPPVGPFASYSGHGITVLVGDVFALRPEHCGPIHGIFDRAALIALRPDQRARYVEVLQRALQPGGVLLQITLEYDQTIAPGPPWSVPPTLVESLWPGAVRIDTRNAGGMPARFGDGAGTLHIHRWPDNR